VDDSTQRGASRETLIVDALSEVFRMLDEMARTPHSRELRAQARSYDLAVKNWSFVAPTFAQLDAMFELVVDLHGRVVTAHRRPA
jgi:hypothetical protein